MWTALLKTALNEGKFNFFCQLTINSFGLKDRETEEIWIETLKLLFLFTGSLLLESKIQSDTAYQKQQETLIVWSEGENYDLALSFQEKAGCDEIWEKICQVKNFLNFFLI